MHSVSAFLPLALRLIKCGRSNGHLVPEPGPYGTFSEDFYPVEMLPSYEKAKNCHGNKTPDANNVKHGRGLFGLTDSQVGVGASYSVSVVRDNIMTIGVCGVGDC